MQILIPAKSISTRVPGKNMRPLGGRPLIWWTLEKCRRWLPGVPVWVATDDLRTIEYARSVLNCNHYHLTENDLLDRRDVRGLATEFAGLFSSSERIVVLHVTSPFTLRSELRRVFESPARLVQTGVERVLHPVDDFTLSQELRPTRWLTGNVFAGWGKGDMRGVPEMVPVGRLSEIDINTPEEFSYAERIASRLGFDWLDDLPKPSMLERKLAG